MNVSQLTSMIEETGAEGVMMFLRDYEILKSDPAFSTLAISHHEVVRTKHHGQGTGNSVVIEFSLSWRERNVRVKVVALPPFDPKNTEKDYARKGIRNVANK